MRPSNISEYGREETAHAEKAGRELFDKVEKGYPSNTLFLRSGPSQYLPLLERSNVHTSVGPTITFDSEKYDRILRERSAEDTRPERARMVSDALNATTQNKLKSAVWGSLLTHYVGAFQEMARPTIAKNTDTGLVREVREHQ
jgi:hypothetical protein